MSRRMRWIPVVVLALAWLGVHRARSQPPLPLLAPLDQAIPTELLGLTGAAVDVRDVELELAMTSSFLARGYSGDSATSGDSTTTDSFELHVCHYERKRPDMRDRAPRLCHMSPYWHIVRWEFDTVETEEGDVPVRRFLLRRDQESAIALYWHHNGPRIAADPYVVRWNQLVSAMFLRRSDEALVRVLVPITGDEAEAVDFAHRAAREALPHIRRALPNALHATSGSGVDAPRADAGPSAQNSCNPVSDLPRTLC